MKKTNYSKPDIVVVKKWTTAKLCPQQAEETPQMEKH